MEGRCQRKLKKTRHTLASTTKHNTQTKTTHTHQTYQNKLRREEGTITMLLPLLFLFKCWYLSLLPRVLSSLYICVCVCVCLCVCLGWERGRKRRERSRRYSNKTHFGGRDTEETTTTWRERITLYLPPLRRFSSTFAGDTI